MQGTCPLCGYEGQLTKDHIIPKWLYANIHLLGMKKNLGQRNIQYICSHCNSRKGGRPDFKNPIAKGLKKKIIKYIQDN